MKCYCRRYPETDCIEESEALLCPQCEAADCVVIMFHDEGVPSVEHISEGELIIDPFSEESEIGVFRR